MEKFTPYEKLPKKGSDTTAAGGGFREWSELNPVTRKPVNSKACNRKKSQA